MREEDKQKAIRYLYEKGINNSSRKKSFPRENNEISLPYQIDVINVGVKALENQAFIRVSFIGSMKFYDLGIQYDRFDYWCNFAKSFYNISNDMDMLDELVIDYKQNTLLVTNKVEEHKVIANNKSLLSRLKEKPNEE